jgi:hypothetical protein
MYLLVFARIFLLEILIFKGLYKSFGVTGLIQWAKGQCAVTQNN